MTSEGVHEFRQRFLAVFDRVAMQVAADTEFAAEDEADMVQQIELDESSREVGRD